MKQALTLALFCFFYFIPNAQENVSATGRLQAVGFRLSTPDAAVNHSISYRYFFNQQTAAEVLVTVANPGAIGLMLERFKDLRLSGVRWFWGAGMYAAFGSTRRFGA